MWGSGPPGPKTEWLSNYIDQRHPGIADAGNIYLPHPLYASWVNDSIDECAAFPNGAHDDQAGGMAQALLRRHLAVRQEAVVYLPDYSRGYQISPI